MEYVRNRERAEEIIKNLQQEAVLQFDTETTGLDWKSNELLLFQIGTSEEQYVFDASLIGLNSINNLLSAKKLIIFNANFDLKFLYKHNIVPSDIYDPYLAEIVLKFGIDSEKSLKALLKRRLNVLVEKEIRESFLLHKGKTFSKAQLEYAANDVRYLKDLMEDQLKEGRRKDLIKAINLENSFVRVLSYIEFCGLKLNKEKWTKRAEKSLEKLQEAYKNIVEYIWSNDEFKIYRDNQYDMFSNENKIVLNLDSAKQMKQVFKTMGFDLNDSDVKSGESASERVLLKYKDNEFVSLFLTYKHLKKDVSTYGLSFLDSIDPHTGRIHTNYTQMVSSGRTVSSSPNLNNIPKDPETRECFEAEEGNSIINADYSDQEGRLFANFSGEPNLINFYKSGFADGHSYTAKLCFPNELENIPMEEVKDKRPDLRSKAKSARFAINYGGTGFTIAKNLNITEREGEEVYNAYMKAFPKMEEYFNKVKRYTELNGYILISPITKRKKFHPYFHTLNKYDYEYKEFLKLSLNLPIQGSAAEMSKIALIRIFDKIISNSHFGIVKIVGFVYDEILLECPNELAEYYAEIVKESMESSAKIFCPYVEIPVEPEIATYWKH